MSKLLLTLLRGTLVPLITSAVSEGARAAASDVHARESRGDIDAVEAQKLITGIDLLAGALVHQFEKRGLSLAGSWPD